MEAESVELEDGEIVDNEPLDVFGSYNILQRPANVTKIEEPPVITYSDDSDDSDKNVSDSDESDSDSSRLKFKKQKVSSKRFRKNRTKSSDANNDKYKVWLGQVQEEILTQNLVSCGVTKSLYSDRSVESYDFTLRHEINDRTECGEKSSDDDKEKGGQRRRFTNKRTFSDRKNGKLRLETGISQLGLGKTAETNVIPSLAVTAESTNEEVAEDISHKLDEKKSDLIRKVVDIAGKEKAIEFYEKTKKIEEEGGMLILNGSRRRTPGGVYLFLVKNDRHIPRSDIREIFCQDRKDHADQRRKISAVSRKEKSHDLRRRLENNSDKDLPALLTRHIAEEARLRRDEGMDRLLVDSDRTVSNPPPSPVTDDPDHTEQPPPHHGRQIQSYSDDILDIGVDADSMDLF